MTHPIIKTDNYLLITSDEEIKEDCYAVHFSPLGEIELVTADGVCKLDKKVIAHLSLNNSPILEGVPLLPPLPNEEDVDKLVNNYVQELVECKSVKESERTWISAICHQSITKAKEKYKFTEEDIIKAIKMTRGSDIPIETIIQSISQPKLPIGFKCRIEYLTSSHVIINGVMQGQWIFE